MKSPTAVLAAAGICLLAVHTAPIAAHAQAAAEFFNNRQMTMLISTTVGGGYDIFGRMFARHMGKYLPGGTARFTVREHARRGRSGRNQSHVQCRRARRLDHRSGEPRGA